MKESFSSLESSMEKELDWDFANEDKGVYRVDLEEGFSDDLAESAYDDLYDQSPEILTENPEHRARYEIGELERPLHKILNELREHLERGGYSHIIVDDASGRLPGLIMRKVIGAIYKEKKLSMPNTIFFAGGKDVPIEKWPEKQENLKRYFQQMLKKNNRDLKYHSSQKGGDRALIVTDTIASGKTIGQLTDVLRELGVSYDIATAQWIGKEPEETENTGRENLFGGRLYVGEYNDQSKFGNPSLEIWNSQTSGVEKDSQDPHQVVSRPLKGNAYFKDPMASWGDETLYKAEMKEIIKATRAEVDAMSKKLYERYKAFPEKPEDDW